MSDASRGPRLPSAELPPMFVFAAALATNLLHVQRAQVEALGAWQRAIGAMQQELWDEWACRWAGGVPIDA